MEVTFLTALQKRKTPNRNLLDFFSSENSLEANFWILTPQNCRPPNAQLWKILVDNILFQKSLAFDPFY